MKSFLGFILGIALICGSAAAKSGSEVFCSFLFLLLESKYQRLQKMMVNNQVTLNDDTYTEFLLRGDRDFDAFVLYTTIGNRYQCRLCPYCFACVLHCVARRMRNLLAWRRHTPHWKRSRIATSSSFAFRLTLLPRCSRSTPS